MLVLVCLIVLAFWERSLTFGEVPMCMDISILEGGM